MEPTDITTEMLKGIRDEIRATRTDLAGRIDATNVRLREMNGRLGEMNGRVGETNGRLDDLRTELSRRIVDSEVRTATALTDLAGTVREMTGVLRTQADLRPRVEKCERDIDELRRRASGE